MVLETASRLFLRAWITLCNKIFIWACAWVTATIFTILRFRKHQKKLFNMRDFGLWLKTSQKRVFRGHLVSVNSYKKMFVFEFYTKKTSCVISAKIFIPALLSAQVYANRMHRYELLVSVKLRCSVAMHENSRKTEVSFMR